MSRINSRDTDDDERDIFDNDDTDDQEFERSEAIAKVISEMTDEQRERFNLFRVGTACKLPDKRIKEMMLKSVQGYADRSKPDSIVVQETSVKLASMAVKLFAADLLETAKSLTNEQLTPDIIGIAYNHLVNKGIIPGLGPGVKRPMFK